jgi:RNA polymerase sigma factor (sigma-70 family)
VVDEGYDTGVSIAPLVAQSGDVSDSRLLDGIRAGDERAFEVLFLRHYAAVYGIARKITGNAEEAEEIAHDTFLRLYRQPLPPGKEANVRGWLYRVATNAAFNAVRARHRRLGWTRRLLQRAPTNAPDDPQEVAIAQEEARHVRLALAELPEHQRTVLVLRAAGLSYAEISAAVGIERASVGTLLSRAEGRLRERYLQAGGVNGG